MRLSQWGAVLAIVLLCMALEGTPVLGKKDSTGTGTVGGSSGTSGPSTRALPPPSPLPDEGLVAPFGYTEAVEAELMRQIGAALTNGDLSLLTEPGSFRTTPYGQGLPCTAPWPGVRCRFAGTEKYVYLISFENMRGVLTGSLSSAISDLQFLESLTVNNLGITGTLPALPFTIASLDVERNAISGTVPDYLASNTRLLLLGENKLSGTIPYDLLMFNTNAQVSLRHNHFSGTVPSSIKNVRTTNLLLPTLLDFSSNQLSGTIPSPWILDDVYLEEPYFVSGSRLDLSKNRMSGLIPPSLLNETVYNEIILSSNIISGYIPVDPLKTAYATPALLKLDLSNNRISGYLPNAENLKDVHSFRDMWLDTNMISGFITTDVVDSHPMLKTLKASYNRLSGTLPLVYTDDLLEMHIAGNSISGSLPVFDTYGFPPSLEILNVTGNQFSQSIDTAFNNDNPDFHGFALVTLDVSNNDLFGTFPDTFFTAMTYLQTMDFSQNQISGTLSEDFSLLTTLETLSLGFNKLSGSIPCLPSKLVTMRLEHNELTGAAFPNCLGGLALPSQTRIYSVANNLLGSITQALTGTSPPSLFLQSASEIYAQNNLLTGTLPDTLFCSFGLQIFDMHNNSISGTLPLEAAFGLKQLLLDNNFISGTVPLEYGYSRISTLALSNNKLSGLVPLRDIDYSMTDALDVCGGSGGPGRRRNLLQTGSPPLFEKLEAALLDHNNFTGRLDVTWLGSHYPKLHTLRASCNHLNGTLDVDTSQATGDSVLAYLDLSDNELEGNISANFPDAFPLLHELRLGSNRLIGTIPSVLGTGLASLLVLSLEANSLSGTLPDELASLGKLQELDVSNNFVGGFFPAVYGQLQELARLAIFNSPLSGCLPPFSSLVAADVVLTGTFISGVCNGDVVLPRILCTAAQSIAIGPAVTVVDCSASNSACPSNMRDLLSPEVVEAGGPYTLTFSPTTFVKGEKTKVVWTAVDAVGNVGTCEGNVTLVSQLELVALEVTQSVQDWDLSVPLVAKKSTLVRAFVQMADNDTRDPVEGAALLDGYLEGFRNGESLGKIAKVNHEGALTITKYIRAGRGYIRGSFNFLLPEAWVLPGELTVCFRGLPSEEYPEFDPVSCNEQEQEGRQSMDCCVSVSFMLVSKPCFRFIKVRYRDNENVLRVVTDAVLHEQWRRFRSMLPIPANSVADFRQFDFVYGSRPPLRVVNNALDATRVIDNLSQRCWYIGVLQGQGGGLAELGGETAAFYVGQSEGSYACGYARNRGVHEFLHNLGIEHARQGNVTACSTIENNSPNEFPFLESLGDTDLVIRPTLGPMSDNDTLVWGTDPQLAATGAPSTVAFSSPHFVFALMSYCQPANLFGCQARWIDRDTYVQAMNLINGLAPTGPQPLGADTPADISMFRGSIATNGDDYSVVLGPVLQLCTTADALDKSTGTQANFRIVVNNGTDDVLDERLKARQATADLIDCFEFVPNCPPKGTINDYGDYPLPLMGGSSPVGCAYCFGSFDQFTEVAADGFRFFSFDLYPTFSFDVYPTSGIDLVPTFSFDGFPFFNLDNATYMLFDGWPSFSFDTTGLPTRSEAVLQGTFVAADFGGFLEEIAGSQNDFDGISSGVEADGSSIRTVDFSLVKGKILPGPTETLQAAYTIQFLFDDELSQRVIATFNLSAHAPTISGLTKAPLGDVVSGISEVTLCFNIVDEDGGDTPLTTTVQYCPDYDINMCSCEVLTLDYIGTDEPVNNAETRGICLTYAKSKLRASSSAVFRVYVSDGLRSTDAVTEPFSVANNEPYVAIVFPTDGTRSAQGLRLLYLSGAADDLEDGRLDSTCSWMDVSDPSNPIFLSFGIDTAVDVSTLGPGMTIDGCSALHTIVLGCRDSSEAVGYDSVNHTIIGSSGAPIISCPDTAVGWTTEDASCSGSVSYALPNATDSCGITRIQPTLVSPSWAIPGGVFPGGDTVVTYRAVEPLTKKVATCEFVVRVVDIGKPQLTCNNITVPAVRSGAAPEGVTSYSVDAIDACDVPRTHAVDPAYEPGSIIPFGTHLVEFAAMDKAGNVDTCTFNLTVFEVGCFATCAGTTGPYVFQFTLAGYTTGPSALTPEQTCLWNFVVGTIAGVTKPDDPCVVSSAPVSGRRRLLQSGVIVQAIQMFFSTEAEALVAQQLILAAIADGRLLAELQLFLPFLEELTLDLASVWVGPQASVSGDPHFQGPCGQHFDFMGTPGDSFCLMTSEALHVNGRMMGPRTLPPNAQAEAHNTWIQELGILYRGANITISADSVPGSAFKAYHGRVYVNGLEVTNMYASKATLAQGDLGLERRKTRVKLTLGAVATLQVDIVRASFWEVGHGPGANFLNLKVLRLARSADWHGVLGHTFGKPCDGSTGEEEDDLAAVTGSGMTKYRMTETAMYHSSGILATDCAVSKFVQRK